MNNRVAMYLYVLGHVRVLVGVIVAVLLCYHGGQTKWGGSRAGRLFFNSYRPGDVWHRDLRAPVCFFQ